MDVIQYNTHFMLIFVLKWKTFINIYILFVAFYPCCVETAIFQDSYVYLLAADVLVSCVTRFSAAMELSIC